MSRDFGHMQQVRARNRHICDECREQIIHKDVYRRLAWKRDGDFGFCILCEVCFACLPEDDEAEWRLGELLDYYRDETDGMPGAELPEPAPVDDKTLPMFGAENAPRIVKPKRSAETLRLFNLLRKSKGMSPIRIEET